MIAVLNSHPTEFLQKQRARLVAMRAEITQHAVESRFIPEREVGDLVDAGNDDAAADLAFTIHGKDTQTLREINLAIARIDKGIYGLCEVSGELIPAERLEALPFTRCSITAARNSEKLMRPRRQSGIVPETEDADEPDRDDERAAP